MMTLDPDYINKLYRTNIVKKWAYSIQIGLEDIKVLKSNQRGISAQQSTTIGNKRGNKTTIAEMDEYQTKEKAKMVHDLILKDKEPPFNSKAFLNNETYVYIIPHTHTDLGWLSTVEEYYAKSNQL